MKKLLCLTSLFYQLSSAANINVLSQYGLLDDILHGQYNEIANVKQIAQHGDFAIGAGIGLGELIGVDGKFYIADAYGNLKILKNQDKVSFASIAKFHSKCELGFSIKNISSLKQLEDQIEKELPNKNMIYAIKVTGHFDKLHARSEDIDSVPYTPIVSWMQHHQHEFDCNNQQSTLVIFRMPDTLSNLGVKYHTHFVNGNRTVGGHVFNIASSHELDIEIMPLSKANVYLRENNVAIKHTNNNLQTDKFYTVIERNEHKN